MSSSESRGSDRHESAAGEGGEIPLKKWPRRSKNSGLARCGNHPRPELKKAVAEQMQIKNYCTRSKMRCDQSSNICELARSREVLQGEGGWWTSEEDGILSEYIKEHGNNENWTKISKNSGLSRSGPSCRARWENYLKPDLKKKGPLTEEEKHWIVDLQASMGNKWTAIAKLMGRSQAEIKHYWKTRKKKLKRARLPLYHRREISTNMVSKSSESENHDHKSESSSSSSMMLEQGSDIPCNNLDSAAPPPTQFGLPDFDFDEEVRTLPDFDEGKFLSEDLEEGEIKCLFLGDNLKQL